MKRRKIVMLPLDERPCNFDYPSMMPRTEFDLVLPPKEFMGKKKQPGDTEKIADWLISNSYDADAMVISLDTLVYGGILPSRLHHSIEQELYGRVDTIRKIKEINPDVKLYLFGLIMRCPSYSSDDEEPDYYEICGKEIHLYGRYTHLEKLNKLTKDDRADFDRIKAIVKKEYLDDYLCRRQINLAVLMNCLELAKDGLADYFIIPQDDAAVYGFTSMDQIKVREYLKCNNLLTRTAMYPSADDTGLTLLARANAELSGIKPKIYVHYSSAKGGFTIPQVEDRIVAETVKYHILSVGGVQVYSLPEADILLAVNVGSSMLDEGDPLCVGAYDIERNIAEFINYISYATEMKKHVAIADIAWLNTADTLLTSAMHKEKMMLSVSSYAGWNTSSNTTGTALCQAILYMIGSDKKSNISFLLHRYYEDIGYMAYARSYVTENKLAALRLDYRHTDGSDGKAAQYVKEAIVEYMKDNYPDISCLVEDVCVRLPWDRMFEADVKLKTK